MKGTLFAKPLEFNLTTEQEEWKQAEVIKGSLKVKNHGSEPISTDDIKIILAYGTFKKVRAKDENSWKEISSCPFGQKITLGPGEEMENKWEFGLDDLSPITDKNGSLYILFGDGSDHWKCGQLQLNVDLKHELNYFLETFVNFFRFKIGPKKYKKGITEIKMIPPKSKEFVTVDQLLCHLSFDQGVIKVKYCFKVRALDTLGGVAIVQKKTKEFEQEIHPKQYQLYGAPNYDGLKETIGEIIQKVIPKVLF